MLAMNRVLLFVALLLLACAQSGGRFTNTLPSGDAFDVVLARRPGPGDDPPPPTEPFRVTPVAPIEEIRCRIDGTKPPVETGRDAPPELVDVARLDPRVRLDVRYATDRNFLGVPVYPEGRVLLQRPAAEALLRVRARLEPYGFGLLLHDGYRPWRITKLFWEAVPPESRSFVADPSRGSRHNRGCAIDLSLFDLKSGRPLPFPSDYDAFTEAAHPDSNAGTPLARWRRDLLRAAMEAEGFHVNTREWWHFDYQSWERYPILDIPFDAVPALP